MNLRGLLTGLVVAGSLTVQAQNWVNDSVTMGPGYGGDVFYSLHNGVALTHPNIDWQLAFQMTPPGPYGNVSVLANHVQTGVQVYSLHMKASNHFDALLPIDTVGMTSASIQLYNSDTSWNYGAFNQMNNTLDPYDYSWGRYDITTHNVVGDSLYLIKTGTAGTPYKVWIQKFVSYPFDSVKWIFRIAQLDGTGDTTVTIRRSDYNNRLFAYYNTGSRVALDREPDRFTWDFVFTRYMDTASQGPVTMRYGTTGVLSNFNLMVADVRGLTNGDTTNFQSYTRVKDMNTIGYDWKTFNFSTNTYVVDNTINYFIKTANSGEYYQLQFTRFDGGSTGKIVFRKRALATTGIAGVAANNVAAWHIAPNPATDNVSVMVDSKEASADAKLIVMDASGRMVQQLSAPLVKGMNGYSFSTSSLANGMYFVRLGTSSWNVSTRLVVAH